MGARVEPLTPAREDAALAFLDRSPFENVFLASLVSRPIHPELQRSLCVALDDERIAGVGYFGKQIVIACDDVAIEAFAKTARRFSGERTIVGPRETVRRLWDFMRGWHPPPRAVRDRQPVMAVDRGRLQTVPGPVSVRRARGDEWRDVTENSARMIEHELEYDPRELSPEFSSNVRYMIERGLWWVGESEGRTCFFCHVGPESARTAQLQGIWVPPELRGRGLAANALSQVCDRLLKRHETLSLYVNDFNAAALALYDRVGFNQVAEFQTLLF
ncbi:MAG: GNAT family N-acetyltransferase [Vulcanimicrobiaceae bacterium]